MTVSNTEACRRYRNTPAGKAAMARKEAKRRSRVRRPVAPKRSAADVRAEWNLMLDQATINGWDHKRKCFGRENEFVMYETAPTAEQAEAMCKGCPLLKLCDEYARVSKQSWGIWGGHVWRYGKIVRAEDVEENLVA